MNTRRDFFAFTAGAVAAKTVLPLAARAGEGAKSAFPDADLIAVCAEFDACDRQATTIHGTGPDSIVDDGKADAASTPLRARMHALLDRMEDLRATTPPGIQARAHSLAQHGGHGEYTFDCPTTMAGRLLHMLMRDSVALGGLSASTVASPDTELLAACGEFDGWQKRYLATDFEVAGDDTPEGQAEAVKQREFLDASDPALDRMCELRAVTRDGQAARAWSLTLWNLEMMKPGKVYKGDRLTAAIVRDLIGHDARSANE